jgi:uncharacterized membrane protein YhaH (DUF805 family)
VPIDWAYLLNDFNGRIGRQVFWIAMGAIFALNFLACYVARQIGGDRLSAIVDLLFTYPEFAIAIKRGRDRNMPVWLLGAFFAANALLDLLDVLGWSGTADRPGLLSTVIATPFTVLGLGLLADLGFRRATPPFSMLQFILILVAIVLALAILGVLIQLGGRSFP